jgi:FlaA1/EpsC-like NDP-sugar epimerase
MPAIEALPNCRRKALFSLAFGVLFLLLAWAAHVLRWPIGDRNLGLLAGLGAGALFAAVLLWFTPDTSDAVPKALMQRYRREFTPAMLAYVGVMVFWKKLLAQVQVPALRLLVALLPALLVLWIMRAFIRYVRDSDELQRRIELESGSAAALLIGAGYMAAGFVQTAGLIDVPSKLAMLWVFPSLCLSYGIAKVFIARRYQ